MTVSGPPAAGTPRPYRFPHTIRTTLPSGLRIALANLARVPLVTVTAVFGGAGAAADPAGREGLADLTADMLLEGNAERDGVALADHFESLGSSLTASADWDATLVSFTVHPDRLEAAFGAMVGVISAPAFPESQCARLHAEHRAARLQSIADPRELANLAFDWTCHAPSSRFRRPLEGTLASHGALTRADMLEFWREHCSPNATTLVIAGEVSEAHAAALGDRLAAALPSPRSAPGDATAVARSGHTSVTLVEKPGAAQTELRIGALSVPRNHPDYFRLTVTNAVLGGLFSSRINLNLRERHGYTYGAFSSFDWRRAASPWVVSTAVKSEVTGAAIGETLKEIRGIQSDLITTDELELAANYLVGVFPLRFETTTAVAAALASQATLGLSEDYFDEYRPSVAGVTVRNVYDCARAHFNPDRVQILAAGDPELLRDQLRPFVDGPVTTLSADDVERAL